MAETGRHSAITVLSIFYVFVVPVIGKEISNAIAPNECVFVSRPKNIIVNYSTKEPNKTIASQERRGGLSSDRTSKRDSFLLGSFPRGDIRVGREILQFGSIDWRISRQVGPMMQRNTYFADDCWSSALVLERKCNSERDPNNFVLIGGVGTSIGIHEGFSNGFSIDDHKEISPFSARYVLSGILGGDSGSTRGTSQTYWKIPRTVVKTAMTIVAAAVRSSCQLSTKRPTDRQSATILPAEQSSLVLS